MTRPFQRAKPAGFTLVELLVATTVLILILVVLLGITDQTSRTWRQTTGKIEQFREAREGFESMTRRLSQATLNTFWDYDSTTAPTRYVRQSELRFLSGPTTSIVSGAGNYVSQGVFFQAPIGLTTSASGKPDATGLENLLNTWGYFIEYGDDKELRPSIITTGITPLRSRFRLYELMEPSNDLSIYKYTSGASGGIPKNLSYTSTEWINDSMSKSPATRPARPLAENVIALVVLPKLSAKDDATGTRLAPSYDYDSTAAKSDPQINPRNQLPPVMQVTLVAIDEASAGRLSDADNAAISAKVASLFSNAADFEKDLLLSPDDGFESLADFLTARKIAYRVFTSDVSIRGAKWSTAQAN